MPVQLAPLPCPRATVFWMEMAGATSSSVYAVRTQPGVDAVLRLFDNAAWLADEPDLVAHEAAALGEADRAGCPAPRLIA